MVKVLLACRDGSSIELHGKATVKEISFVADNIAALANPFGVSKIEAPLDLNEIAA